MAQRAVLPTARVLIVDDDADFRRLIRDFVQDSYEVLDASNAGHALKAVEEATPDVVLLDLNLGSGHSDGLALLARIRKVDAALPVVILSASRDTDTVVQAMRLGASHYIEKPTHRDLLIERLRIAVEERGRLSEREAILRQSMRDILGSSPAMVRVRDQARKAAEHPEVSCLIRGETGTGKGLVAEMIHRRGPRSGGPWVHIHIPALNPGLLESELFGHVKGSFTGALEDKKGFFELASRGTIFIDEIGDLERGLQVKLLKLLDDGACFPVGGRTSVTTNAHMLFATHENLERMVASRSFREDLFHRLTGFVIEIPPLRERIDDLWEITTAFLGRDVRITDEAVTLLRGHAWPGNVRELRNVLTRASIAAEGGLIDGNCVQFQSSPSSSEGDAALLALPYHEAMDKLTSSFQRRYLENLLRRCGGVVSRAARESGIARSHLHTMIGKLGLSSLTAGAERIGPADAD